MECIAMVHLTKAFAILPLAQTLLNVLLNIAMADEEVQHQDDHNHLVDSPEGHCHDVRKLQGEVSFRTTILNCQIPCVAFLL